MKNKTNRRGFLSALAGLPLGVALSGCSDDIPPHRYTQSDIDLLAAQRAREAKNSGHGPYGEHVYQGYRGLASLPWFSLDDKQQLFVSDPSIGSSIDMHCHLGMSVLFKPELDLFAKTARVKHLLDCDAGPDGCRLDLDQYINANFTEQDLSDLRRVLYTQGLWGNEIVRTHTLSNLVGEMDSMQVTKAALLPIKLDLPFGDDQTQTWLTAIDESPHSDRFIKGCSIHGEHDNRLEELVEHSRRGAKLLKLHPTVQRFFPDDEMMMPIYEQAQQLGMAIFFHGGRAGIEPEAAHPYAMPRHYKKALANFPKLQFILGHGGARDGDAMLELALQHPNAWLGTHGQGITHLDKMISKTQGRQLLFGTDWPFYHIGASLAKVLITTDSVHREQYRKQIMRGNAQQLIAMLN